MIFDKIIGTRNVSFMLLGMHDGIATFSVSVNSKEDIDDWYITVDKYSVKHHDALFNEIENRLISLTKFSNELNDFALYSFNNLNRRISKN